MRSFIPPRASLAGRKPTDPPRRAPAGPRQAQASLQLASGAGARRGAPAMATPAVRSGGGLPEDLQTVMEAMSGFSLADVVVHRNSAEPARFRAAAFAQGNQIHLAPGEERHLPHEAWHVVQQAQGRVKPTRQMKELDVNADPALEAEADAMGARAERDGSPGLGGGALSSATTRLRYAAPVVQRSAVTQFGQAHSRPKPAAPSEPVVLNRNAFNQQQKKVEKSAAIGEALASVRAKQPLRNLPDLRESLDVLVATYSDGLLSLAGKMEQEEEARLPSRLAVKHGLLARRVAVERIYQTIIRTDEHPAQARLAWNAALAEVGGFLTLNRRSIETVIAATDKKGYREPFLQPEGDTSIDRRSVELAKLLTREAFTPQLIVGLPTAGVQIAVRVAGYLSATATSLPEVAALRPRFVKPPEPAASGNPPPAEEEQKGPAPAEEEQKGPAPAEASARPAHEHMEAINRTEIDRIIPLLPKTNRIIALVRRAPVKVLVVDDFSKTGQSLAMAKALLTASIEQAGLKADVRTAVSRYTNQQLRAKLPDGQNEHDNPIDFMVGEQDSGRRIDINARHPKAGDEGFPDGSHGGEGMDQSGIVPTDV